MTKHYAQLQSSAAQLTAAAETAALGFVGGQRIAEGLEQLGDWFIHKYKSFLHLL